MSKCCGDKKEAVRTQVRESYAKIARSGDLCCCSSGKKKDFNPANFAKVIGYDKNELKDLPEGANMGLSCGNPTAVASLKPGEVVLDLGSGGGFDVFIAAEKVGRKGKSIGVDMTPDMLSKARRNAEIFRKNSHLSNVEFRLGEIEHLPVADNSVDVIISNCVINLSPEKQQVWNEMSRVLRKGGRVAVSDLALLKPLPKSVLESVNALVGCVAGAVLVKETERMAKKAGLKKIKSVLKPDYIDSMSEWNDPMYKAIARKLPRGKKLGDYVTSLYVSAIK
ncbi:MAG TPA: arsenite S-adenosylmethyltransferase [Lentisphaeria bacterium]|nr:MAG: arsenite S-adenosylmethyltransferase [Lentisphaerae bacterium GWF2_50_93]HCE44873.1 arsenite S-adenosylmethyltransferase [Lentisphaeria bacterium]